MGLTLILLCATRATSPAEADMRGSLVLMGFVPPVTRVQIQPAETERRDLTTGAAGLREVDGVIELGRVIALSNVGSSIHLSLSAMSGARYSMTATADDHHRAVSGAELTLAPDARARGLQAKRLDAGTLKRRSSETLLLAITVL